MSFAIDVRLARRPLPIVPLLSLLVAIPSLALDNDGDGIDDEIDNCLLVPNVAQRDTDGDYVGNACDADLNNDWIVNSQDLGLLKASFLVGDDGRSPTVCAPADTPLDDTEAFGTVVFVRGAFNDWLNDGSSAAQYQFFNQGGGRYVAEFTLEEAGDFNFKIADGGWAIEYGNPDVVVEPGVPVPLMGGPALGGPSSVVSVAEPGCYAWGLEILDDSAVPAPLAELVLSPPRATAADFNGDGIVNVVDLGIMRSLFFMPPGPSGVIEADTLPPEVAIEQPQPGDMVTGSVEIAATASDDLGVREVVFSVDGVPIHVDTDAPYATTWDTSAMGDGVYLLGASAVDLAGNVGESSPVSVTVFTDIQPPVVEIVSPVPGAVVEGIVLVQASITDAGTIANATFRADSVIFATLTVPPWSASLQTSTLTNGPHVLTVVAQDAAGNSAGSTPVTVEVQNDNVFFGPFDTAMFVRGAFHDPPVPPFGTEHPLEYLGDGQYEAIVTVDVSTTPVVPFKIADAGWTDGTDCGAEPGQFINLGSPFSMICSMSVTGNMSQNISLLLVARPVDLRFSVDATGFPDQHPVVTVSPVQ